MLVSGCEQQSIKSEAVRWNYTEFVRAVENNGVKQVTIESDETDALDSRAVRAKVITSNHQEIKVWFPTGDHKIELLAENKVLFSFTPSIDSNTFDWANLVTEFKKDNQDSLTEITFTEFIQAVENKEVESISINNDGFEGKAKFTNSSEFKVYLPINSSYLYHILVENNIAISARSQNRNSQTKIAKWTYTQFLQGIKSNKVKQVIMDHRVTKAKIITSDNHQVEVLIPRNVNYTLKLLTTKDISISFELPRSNHTVNTRKIVAESLQQHLSNIPEVTFTEFIQAVENKKVKFFILLKNGVEGRAKLFDGSEFKVVLPFNPSYAIDILVKNNVPLSNKS